jgi:hypothetical protein
MWRCEEGSDALQTGGVALSCYPFENTSHWELYNHVTCNQKTYKCKAVHALNTCSTYKGKGILSYLFLLVLQLL